MRGCLSIFLAFFACSAFGQSPAPTADSEFLAVHPDVLIYVHGHPSGVDAVQISMLDAKYPPETLRKQIDDLCTRLNAKPNGLQVYAYTMENNPKLKFLQAIFAVPGLTDEEGNANLTPLIQAFAGVEAPYTIHGMEVFFDEFDPPIKGPKNFTSNKVIVSGRRDSNPPQVEYAIQLLTQNPSEIKVETKPPVVEPKPKQAPEKNSSPILVWCLILLAGLAASALVYFLLIKRLSGSSATSVLRKP